MTSQQPHSRGADNYSSSQSAASAQYKPRCDQSTTMAPDQSAASAQSATSTGGRRDDPVAPSQSKGQSKGGKAVPSQSKGQSKGGKVVGERRTIGPRAGAMFLPRDVDKLTFLELFRAKLHAGSKRAQDRRHVSPTRLEGSELGTKHLRP